jgi:hypothetical protein
MNGTQYGSTLGSSGHSIETRVNLHSLHESNTTQEAVPPIRNGSAVLSLCRLVNHKSANILQSDSRGLTK